MKGLVKFEGDQSWLIQEVAEEKVEAGQIKIKVKYAGICGSDLHIYKEVFDIPEGLVPGHEFSGIISEIGQGVTGFQIGDRVTAEHTFTVCEKCENCRRGSYQLCKERVSIGFQVTGAFGEYVIANAKYVHKLPENVTLEEGAMTEPLACALHAVELIKPEPTNRILVIGPGPIGILVSLCFKAHNCRVDLIGVPQDKLRLENARAMGINTIEATIADSYDIVADCSGNEKGINSGLKAIKAGGRFLQVGIPGKPVSIDYDTLLYKELKIQGTFCHNYPVWEKALQMESMGLVDVKPLISDIVPLEDWESAFGRLLNQEALKILFKL
jgi:L-iditol 2-dehydrogenase